MNIATELIRDALQFIQHADHQYSCPFRAEPHLQVRDKAPPRVCNCDKYGLEAALDRAIRGV